MNKALYPKLAAVNLKNNRKTCLPYILTCIGTTSMFYMICSLSLNAGIDSMVGSGTIRYILGMGAWVTGFFAAIFLFYTNSFLMKRRKKEFGLYNILGMEKKHISAVIFWETLYIALISLTAGLLLGLLLNKALFLALLKMFDSEIPLGFEIPLPAIGFTLALFCAIFLLIFLNSLRQIHLSNPIGLLKGGETGEKEPKAKWILAILGVLCLGAGYYISIASKDPLAALSMFFVAVILVMIGTYLLFTAGSIAFLKLLRKNKAYYYRTKHFISVSGMMYRMKQNAVGLANICILSTAVLVMISTTFSLYIGMEDILKTRYPRNIFVSLDDYSEQSVQKMHQWIDTGLSEENLTPENEVEYTYLNFAAMEKEDFFDTNRTDNALVSLNNIYNLFFITLKDYNRISDVQETLNDNEILLYSNRTEYGYPNLKVFDMKFKVKETLDDFAGDGIMGAYIANNHFIVVKDISVIQQLAARQKEAYGEMASDIRIDYGFDLSSGRDGIVGIYHRLSDSLGQYGIPGTVECRDASKSDFISLYGGLFFIGIFLGVLFIMATILIIYYKQISEGYEDKERFHIMQKVGMSKEETRKSIRSQVLTVFFLPLVTAGIHVAFAFPVMTRLLAMLNLRNVALFAWCTVICILVFALLYGIVYSLTAKAYYKIVS